jgi:16S rRNA processing protein RimM
LRARGNKGELAAELLTDFPERLTKVQEVFVSPARSTARPRRFLVKNCWLSQNHKGQAVFHFEGVDSISEAEKFRGSEILLPVEQRVVLPAGQYFVSDLMGCTVFEISPAEPAVSSSSCSNVKAPQLLGTVKDVQFPGDEFRGTPILEVDTSCGEILIPLALDICKKIDISERRIEVVLPQGLRELNQR